MTRVKLNKEFAGKIKKGFLCRYFRHFFNRIRHMNFRRTEECSTIIRWLAPQPGEQILDVGCGDGYYDWLIAKLGAKVVGIDIHKKPLSIAQKFYCSGLTDFFYMDAGQMNFPGACFDKVISLCVVEHLADDEQVMQNVSRVLKPGGRFVFSVDSLSNSGITLEERRRHQQRYAVNTFYTVEVVREKLSRAGFDIEETQYILNSPYALALARFSWKLDDLSKAFFVFKLLGYLAAGITLKFFRLFTAHKTICSAGGLTLLVRAKKRITMEPVDTGVLFK